MRADEKKKMVRFVIDDANNYYNVYYDNYSGRAEAVYYRRYRSVCLWNTFDRTYYVVGTYVHFLSATLKLSFINAIRCVIYSAGIMFYFLVKLWSLRAITIQICIHLACVLSTTARIRILSYVTWRRIFHHFENMIQ